MSFYFNGLTFYFDSFIKNHVHRLKAETQERDSLIPPVQAYIINWQYKFNRYIDKTYLYFEKVLLFVQYFQSWKRHMNHMIYLFWWCIVVKTARLDNTKLSFLSRRQFRILYISALNLLSYNSMNVPVGWSLREKGEVARSQIGL